MPGEPNWPWPGSCVDDIWLVASTYPSEKYDSQLVGMILPKIWKNKNMFQTTNQITIIFPLLLVYTLLTTINITMFQTTNQIFHA
jgi:hypothetical protein